MGRKPAKAKYLFDDQLVRTLRFDIAPGVNSGWFSYRCIANMSFVEVEL